MTPVYRQATSYFKPYNKNPKYKTEADCVIRAISGALGESWDGIYRDMAEHCIPKFFIINGKKGYTSYLKSRGYEKQPQPRKANGKKYTAREFCKLYPKGTYILSLAGHLTFVEDGIIYDTWNCGGKSVGNFWRIK